MRLFAKYGIKMTRPVLFVCIFYQPESGRFVDFHHVTFWVGNAKQVNILSLKDCSILKFEVSQGLALQEITFPFVCEP